MRQRRTSINGDMADLSDGDLIAHLQQRRADAMGTLYDRYSRPVYSVFLRVTRDTALAEDLVQELFLRVWNQARAYNPQKGSLGVWILFIARNMAIDYVRSARARFSAKLRPMEEAEYRPATDPSRNDPESTIDDLRTVQSAFSYLNQNQKQVLELAYFEGLSQTEIAAKLEEPLGTVKSWMRSGLSRLRDAIGRGGDK